LKDGSFFDAELGVTHLENMKDVAFVKKIVLKKS
jgi:hypothetical protein